MRKREKNLLQTESNPTLVVIRRELETNLVARHHLDVIEPHLAAQVAQYFSAVFEFDPELGVRKGLGDDSVYLGQWVIGHNFNSASVILPGTGGKNQAGVSGFGDGP